MTYEDLLLEAETAGLIVKEKPLLVSDGRVKGNRIAIRKDIPTLAMKADVLAEEIGHYHTTVGRIIEQDSVDARKQEYRARLYAYDLQVGLLGIIRAFEAGCQNRYEMAEFLGTSEEFLTEALECYRSKYSPCVSIDNYVIFFEPCLGIMKKWE